MLELIKIIIDLVYPRHCPMCHDIIGHKSMLACPECIVKLELIREPRCKKCSKPMETESDEFCFDCIKTKYSYDKGYSLWVYKEEIKQSIYNFKYGGRQEYVDFYADELLKYYKNILQELHVDVIIPVPLSKSKMYKRGYNQAELIANSIAKALGIPLNSKYIYRMRDTTPQKGLGKKERIKNIEKAFKIIKSSVEYKNVLLVDDIYTTGSTIESCSKALRTVGVEKIYYITLCVGRGY